ncbi:MAG: LysM peptidoglycan-binding domain-containing protein [Chthoniobacterales bacterium]
MKFLVFFLAALLLDSALVLAQTSVSPSTTPSSPETLQLQTLTKKIDEQNAKIDILSQQILKLEQQISHARPGIMIGQPEGASATPEASATPIPRPTGGVAHTVERGETLTSIGKLYGVSPSELQRYNHIEDPLKLRAGQTIMIPGSPTPAPSASPGQ